MAKAKGSKGGKDGKNHGKNKYRGKKGKQHHRAGQTKWKKRKIEKFWIEQARETKLSDRMHHDGDDAGQDSPRDPDIVLKITRVQLEDDYRQVNHLTVLSAIQGDDERANGGAQEAATDDTTTKAQSETPMEDDQDDVAEGDSPEVATTGAELDKSGEIANTDEAMDDGSKATPAQNQAGTDCGNDAGDAGIQTQPDTSDASGAMTSADVNNNKNPETSAMVAMNAPRKSNEENRKWIVLKRCSSAKGRAKHFAGDENFKPLPDGDCGDGVKNPHPKDICPDKFWSQRRRLFSRFDSGIQLDKESWYSVTPEAIANHIAMRMVQPFPSDRDEGIIVIDPFCGCGGNSIALARRPEVGKVICVDTDKEKLARAAANAKIYDVEESKMIFVHADACHVLDSYQDGTKKKRETISDAGNGGSDATDENISGNADEHATHRQYMSGISHGVFDSLPDTLDAVFLSPPWGGIDYALVGKRNYDLKCIQLGATAGADIASKDVKIDGIELLRLAHDALGEQKMVAYFLPRNTNGYRLAHSAIDVGFGGVIDMEQNLLNGKLKTITAYLGLS